MTNKILDYIDHILTEIEAIPCVVSDISTDMQQPAAVP